MADATVQTSPRESAVKERKYPCKYCGSPMLTDDDKVDDVITPEGVVAFAISRPQAENIFTKWLAALWFAPSALTSESHLKQFQGIYRPYWTYDSHTMSHWTGERGD